MVMAPSFVEISRWPLSCSIAVFSEDTNLSSVTISIMPVIVITAKNIRPFRDIERSIDLILMSAEQKMKLTWNGASWGMNKRSLLSLNCDILIVYSYRQCCPVAPVRKSGIFLLELYRTKSWRSTSLLPKSYLRNPNFSIYLLLLTTTIKVVVNRFSSMSHLWRRTADVASIKHQASKQATLMRSVYEWWRGCRRTAKHWRYLVSERAVNKQQSRASSWQIYRPRVFINQRSGNNGCSRTTTRRFFSL